MPKIEIASSFSRDQLIGIGPTIRVHVGFDPAFDPQSGQHPSHQERDVWALIDTGAFKSCIDTDLAGTINLDPI